MVIRQAVILAAGRGRRMAEGSKDPAIINTPKPLLSLNGEPIIAHKIRNLEKCGVHVCLVINKDYEHVFREKLSEFNVSYCYQAEPLGTGNALYAAKNFVKDDLFLVLMGDDIVEYDLDRIIKEKTPAVFGYEMDDVSSYGALVINKKGEIDDILEKQVKGRGFANTGVYIMSKSFFDHYSEFKSAKNGEYILTDAPKILGKYGIKFRLEKLDHWFGVNTPKDLSIAQKHAKK